MPKLLAKLLSVTLFLITALALIVFQASRAEPALSNVPEAPQVNQSTLIATAPAAPSVTPAILGGKPVYVLSMTRAGDTVLARCYPGYEPTLTVRAMGSNPSSGGQREGVLTCVQSQ